MLEKKLQEKGVTMNNPEQIFNLDESSFLLVPKEDKVIDEKGSVVKRIISNNERGCITVLFTASAAGVIAPLMILFDLKNPPKKQLLSKIPEGWGVGYSDNGWMTSETFYLFISKVFYTWLISNNISFPVVLFVDNHSSHLSLPLLRFCEENQIELTALYPNSTYIIQPLDVAFFHPLKEAYKRTLRNWRIEKGVINFQKSMFPEVLQLTLNSQDFSQTLKNGFSTCGLFPFNSEAPNYNILGKKKKKNFNASLTKESSSENLTNQETLKMLHHLESQLSSNMLEFFKTQYSLDH